MYLPHLSMLDFFALFLPCIVCLIWGGVLVLTPHRGTARTLYMILLFVSAVYFFVDAFYVGRIEDASDYSLLVQLDAVSQFVTMALVPLMVLYIIVVQGKAFSWPVTYLSLIPCICQGVASLVIYMILGKADAAEFMRGFDLLGAFPPKYDIPIYHAYYAINHTIYNVVLAVEVLGGMGYLIYVFLRQKENRRLCSFILLMFILLSICVFRILLGRFFLMSHAGLSSVLSALMAFDMFFACYIAVGLHTVEGDRRKLLFSDALAKINSPFEPEKDDKFQPSVAEYVASRGPAVNLMPTKPKNLLESFIVYMANERPYLDPELTVQDVCDALHTNRTYISELMSDNFKMSFRDYIGLLRVSAAKRLLRTDSFRNLEDIAAESGFSSSSQFVKKFKEITGTTPRAWLAAQD